MGHLEDNNETYWSHFRFAGGMGVSLTVRGLASLVHAAFPGLPVPKRLHLEVTRYLVNKWADYATARTMTEHIKKEQEKTRDS